MYNWINLIFETRVASKSNHTKYGGNGNPSTNGKQNPSKKMKKRKLAYSIGQVATSIH